MTGKEFVAKFLFEKGIKEVFTLPGIHTLALHRELKSIGIETYMARCERSLIFMADGYSRVKGKTSVVIVTPGPGLLNAASGFLEAEASQVPILVLHIDIEDREKGRGVLHELKDPEILFSSLAKSAIRVKSARELPRKLEESYSLTINGRRSCVLLSIPYSVLEDNVVGERSYIESREAKGFEISDQKLLEELVVASRRPIFLLGSSVLHKNLGEKIEGLCVSCGIPVVTTTGGKGLIDERKNFVFGNVIQKWVREKLISIADLVIAFGTRLRDVETKRRGVRISNLVHIDVDKTYMNRNYKACVEIWGELDAALDFLTSILSGKRYAWKIEELKEGYKVHLKKLEENVGFRILKVIRESIPEDAITVWDLNMLSYWAEYYFPTYDEATFLLPRGSSTIFWGLPASIGAKLAKRERPCLCVVGDGGFLPSSGELATISKYRIPVLILLYNNSSFGVLKSSMEKRYGEGEWMDLENPDFVKLAGCYGLRAERVESVEILSKVLRGAIWDDPTLVEFKFPVFENPWETEAN